MGPPAPAGGGGKGHTGPSRRCVVAILVAPRSVASCGSRGSMRGQWHGAATRPCLRSLAALVGISHIVIFEACGS